MTDAKLAEFAALPLAERVKAVLAEMDEIPEPTPEQVEAIAEVWARTH